MTLYKNGGVEMKQVNELLVGEKVRKDARNMKPEHQEQIKHVLDAVKARKIENVFFVACGGSMASLSFGDYFFTKETEMPSFVYTSNEFVHRNPKALGKNSLVILRSHSGTTPETVQAASFSREKGALTVAIS